VAQRRGRHHEPAGEHEDGQPRDAPPGEEAGGERRPAQPGPVRLLGGHRPAGPEGPPPEDRQQRRQERDRHDHADDGGDGERGREGAEELDVAHEERRGPEGGREPGGQDDRDHVGARTDRRRARVAAAEPRAHAEEVEDRVVGHDPDEER
jgi:hypothetical protein